jgi:hypothetical protein
MMCVECCTQFDVSCGHVVDVVAQLILTVSRQSREISELKNQLASLIALASSSSIVASLAGGSGSTYDVARSDRAKDISRFLQRFMGALENLVAQCESMSVPQLKSGDKEKVAARQRLCQGCGSMLMYLQKIVSSPDVSRYNTLPVKLFFISIFTKQSMDLSVSLHHAQLYPLLQYIIPHPLTITLSVTCSLVCLLCALLSPPADTIVSHRPIRHSRVLWRSSRDTRRF